MRPPNAVAAAVARIDARAVARLTEVRVTDRTPNTTRRACAICYGTGDQFEPHDLAAPREAASCPECRGLGTVPMEKR